MWNAPENIPPKDWAELSAAWDKRKEAVCQRFTDVVPDFPVAEVDAMMRSLLRAYYRAETNAEKGEPFEVQLRDEFYKAHLVDGMIGKLKRDYPEMGEPAEVHFDDHNEILTRADKCIGGVVRAFIEVTREACSERFGRPYDGKDKALRNGVLERSAWDRAEIWYAEKRRAWQDARKQDPNAPPPEIYRQ